MNPFTGGDIMLIIIGGLFIYGIFKMGKATGRSIGKKIQCPRCGKYGMEPKGGRYYRNGQAGSDWECPHCGHGFFRNTW